MNCGKSEGAALQNFRATAAAAATTAATAAAATTAAFGIAAAASAAAAAAAAAFSARVDCRPPSCSAGCGKLHCVTHV